MSSLGTIVPEGLYCYVLCYKASRHTMWFFTSTLILCRAHTQAFLCTLDSRGGLEWAGG